MPKHPGTFPALCQYVLRANVWEKCWEALSVITGGGDMLTSDCPEWKVWRSAFNPGFSVAHLMTMMPTIFDSVATITHILHKHAINNELFRMEHHATRLTIDIIGKIVL